MLIRLIYDKLIVLLGQRGARYRIIEHKAEGRTDIASVLRRMIFLNRLSPPWYAPASRKKG